MNFEPFGNTFNVFFKRLETFKKVIVILEESIEFKIFNLRFFSMSLSIIKTSIVVYLEQWLISNDFQGLEGQIVPHMSDEYIETVSDRYIELYENITGQTFIKADVSNIQERIEANVLKYLQN